MQNKNHGKCHCGCGEITNIYKYANSAKKIIKGEHRKFIKGHYKQEPKFSTCHPNRIIKAKGLCASCYNKYLLDKNPEKRIAINKATSIKNKEKIKNRTPAERKKFAIIQRNRHLKHRYNIDIPEYKSILTQQNNSCAICKTTKFSNDFKLYVDHNHITGQVRGLLCPACNTAIGHIEKGDEFVKTCLQYIKNNGLNIQGE